MQHNVAGAQLQLRDPNGDMDSFIVSLLKPGAAQVPVRVILLLAELYRLHCITHRQHDVAGTQL